MMEMVCSSERTILLLVVAAQREASGAPSRVSGEGTQARRVACKPGLGRTY